MSKESGISPPIDREAEAARKVGLIELFLVFSQLGLSSFGGGVTAWVHRAFVERRGWLTQTEFAAQMALARIMPGANVVNLAVLVGERLRGARGAIAAALGLLAGPSLAVVALAIVYRRFAGAMVLHSALEGAAAAAIGLLIGMGVQAGANIVCAEAKSGRRSIRSLGAVAILAAMFVLVGLLRYRMVPVVLCLAPLSIALSLLTIRHAAHRPTG